jgi:hypothetical protein
MSESGFAGWVPCGMSIPCLIASSLCDLVGGLRQAPRQSWPSGSKNTVGILPQLVSRVPIHAFQNAISVQPIRLRSSGRKNVDLVSPDWILKVALNDQHTSRAIPRSSTSPADGCTFFQTQGGKCPIAATLRPVPCFLFQPWVLTVEQSERH